MLKASDMLTSSQLSQLYSISSRYNVDPKLILSIGWLETHWGRLGDGRKGMYTGYQSFDSGSNYGASGFVTQVTGTAKKMAAWGMTPGNVSLSRLQQGQAGRLPTGIYATSKTWAGSIWQIYRELEAPAAPVAAGLPVSVVSAWKEGAAQVVNIASGNNADQAAAALKGNYWFMALLAAGVAWLVLD